LTQQLSFRAGQQQYISWMLTHQQGLLLLLLLAADLPTLVWRLPQC
jgi:hypothetical protein